MPGTLRRDGRRKTRHEPDDRGASPGLLDLPPELDQALMSGRCTCPRTLHELSRLHDEERERVRALVAGEADITRTAVTAVRASVASPSSSRLLNCARLEHTPACLNSFCEGETATLRVSKRRAEDTSDPSLRADNHRAGWARPDHFRPRVRLHTLGLALPRPDEGIYAASATNVNMWM